jgi:hypothetical protein
MTPATANSAAGEISATTNRRGWYVDQLKASGVVQLKFNGALVPASGYTLTGVPSVDALNIASTANKNLATAAGLILDAKATGFSSSTVSLLEYANNATSSTDERYTSAALTTASTDTGSLWTTGREDLFTVTVGSNSVTASLSGYSVAGTAIADIEQAIVAAWAAKYGTTGTASLSAIATVADSGTGKLTFDMLQDDSGGFGKAVSFSVSDGSTTTNLGGATRTSGNIGYVIGATAASNDNSTTASTQRGLIITLTSPNSGTLQNSILTGATITGNPDLINTIQATLVAFTTNYTSNTTWTGGTTVYAGVLQPRTDVVTAEALVPAATSNAVAAVKFNRVTWLG